MKTTVLNWYGQKVLTADEYNTTVVYNTVANELGKASKKFLKFCRNSGSTKETSLPIIIEDEFGDRYAIRITLEKEAARLHKNWCECGDKYEFHSYPTDGACTCGVYKHHVHCATCGGIHQIG